VTAMTISPRIRERENEPPKSPTACCSVRFLNQCSDDPFIGKVSPPSGPWNDRIRMVEIGP